VGLGRRDEGLAELSEAVRLADGLGGPTARWQFRASLGAALYATGDDHGAARAYYESAAIIRAYAEGLSAEHAAHFVAAQVVRAVLKLG
jgi:hypothetical protein